jgi:hypothetical protein
MYGGLASRFKGLVLTGAVVAPFLLWKFKGTPSQKKLKPLAQEVGHVIFFQKGTGGLLECMHKISSWVSLMLKKV